MCDDYVEASDAETLSDEDMEDRDDSESILRQQRVFAPQKRILDMDPNHCDRLQEVLDEAKEELGSLEVKPRKMIKVDPDLDLEGHGTEHIISGAVQMQYDCKYSILENFDEAKKNTNLANEAASSNESMLVLGFSQF